MSNEIKIFKPYLEFYWKFMAVCLVILVIWIGMKATFDRNLLKSFIEDEVVIFLIFLIVSSGISFLYNVFKNKTIIIDEDYVIFKNRFGEFKISIEDIEFVKFGRERLFQFKEKLRVIKIKTKNRRKLITVKPSRYLEEFDLYETLIKLKQ